VLIILKIKREAGAMSKDLEILQAKIKHLIEADDCDCNICNDQLNHTYLDGLIMALGLFAKSSKKIIKVELE
jgi:hypothetical protein